jgi:hypothetical protein
MLGWFFRLSFLASSTAMHKSMSHALATDPVKVRCIPEKSRMRGSEEGVTNDAAALQLGVFPHCSRRNMLLDRPVQGSNFFSLSGRLATMVRQGMFTQAVAGNVYSCSVINFMMNWHKVDSVEVERDQ